MDPLSSHTVLPPLLSEEEEGPIRSVPMLTPIDLSTGRALPTLAERGLSRYEVDDTERLTMVMLSHQMMRVDDAVDVMERYAGHGDIFAEMILIWNSPSIHLLTSGALAARLRALAEATRGRVRVSLFESRFNSMNNRFAVWPYVRTRGVWIQDDDQWVAALQLQCLHRAWLADTTALVGAVVERTDFAFKAPEAQPAPWVSTFDTFEELTPQDCDPVAEQGGVYRCTYPSGHFYSMLLPHPWLLARDHLQSYMAMEAMTALVDNMTNCDDILMNALVANATGRPPVAVDVQVLRHATWRAKNSAMWQRDPDWVTHRSTCMRHVQEYFRPVAKRTSAAQCPASPPMIESGAVWQRSHTWHQCREGGLGAPQLDPHDRAAASLLTL